MLYSNRMPKEDQRHVQIWLAESLAETVDVYARMHGGISFVDAIRVLLSRQLRAEGITQGEPHENSSQGA